jgi:hypothetical protein
MKGIRLIKISFDNLENHCPMELTVLGTFVAGDHLTAHGKVAKFINNMDPISMYLGYDGQVYPQYLLETCEVI